MTSEAVYALLDALKRRVTALEARSFSLQKIREEIQDLDIRTQMSQSRITKLEQGSVGAGTQVRLSDELTKMREDIERDLKQIQTVDSRIAGLMADIERLDALKGFLDSVGDVDSLKKEVKRLRELVTNAGFEVPNLPPDPFPTRGLPEYTSQTSAETFLAWLVECERARRR